MHSGSATIMLNPRLLPSLITGRFFGVGGALCRVGVVLCSKSKGRLPIFSCIYLGCARNLDCRELLPLAPVILFDEEYDPLKSVEYMLIDAALTCASISLELRLVNDSLVLG